MFEEMSSDVILKRMLSRVSDKVDKREGAVIYDALAPAALELQYMYIALERLLKEGFADTASREFLVLRCKERGIEPFEATHTVLRGVFVPKNINVLGKRFNIGNMNYVAVEQIAEGEYKMRCETAGTEGNRVLGDLTPVEYINGLEKAELTEVIIPGEESEDTEALRERYLASFDEKAFGGNAQDYITAVSRIRGVGGVKVKRAWNTDISPSELIPDEEAERWYENILPNVPETVKSWLTKLFDAAKNKKLTTGGAVLITLQDSEYGAASKELLQAVQNEIDPVNSAGEGVGIAPIGHIVKIQSAEEVKTNIKVGITFADGYGWGNLRESIKAAAEDYFLELRKEWKDNERLTVRISRLETKLLSVTGVVDVFGTVLNGADDNLILDEFQIPVLADIGEIQ